MVITTTENHCRKRTNEKQLNTLLSALHSLAPRASSVYTTMSPPWLPYHRITCPLQLLPPIPLTAPFLPHGRGPVWQPFVVSVPQHQLTYLCIGRVIVVAALNPIFKGYRRATALPGTVITTSLQHCIAILSRSRKPIHLLARSSSLKWLFPLVMCPE